MAPVWVWIALFATLAVAIATDLFSVKGRVSLRAGLWWSVAWTAIGLAFTVVVAYGLGGAAAHEYVTGFLLERSLSLDNVFVFAVIFGYFVVPPALQNRALMWGVLGALAFRAAFIVAGLGLLDAFEWTVLVFGAFLIVTGVRLAFSSDQNDTDPRRNVVLRLLRRLVPTSDEFEGNRVVTRRAGALVATPMLGVLAVIASTDLLFAIDSIPAVFAVTRDAFVVFAANAFGVLGLRSLYFVLADLIERFGYLKYGLALLLVLIGGKLLVHDWVSVPVWVVLAGVVVIVGVSIAASFIATDAD